MIEKPVQSVERHIAVDLLKDIQESFNGLVVGGVQAKRPALFGEKPDNAFKLGFQGRVEIWPWLEKVLKVRSRKDKHLACAVEPQGVVTLVQRSRRGPFAEVFDLMIWALGEQVVRNAQGHLPALV